MTTDPPRFEFRIFGAECLALGARVQHQAELGEAQLESEDEDQDVYILAPSALDQNCKIRDGHLEVKSLLAYKAGLEQWQPTLDIAFPVPADWLGDELFLTLQAEKPSFERVRYTPHQLLQEIVAPHPLLQAVSVYKQRHHYRWNECQVELGEIRITHGDEALQSLQIPASKEAISAADLNELTRNKEESFLLTVALEAESAAAVQGIRELLGLRDHTNVNYVQLLERFTIDKAQ
ncbi:MAG: hypothetical protein R3C14_26955 [Caldilineaceae bacterium]